MKTLVELVSRGYMYVIQKKFFLDMFLGVPFQVGLFRGSVLTVLPRCRFVPHLQCYRAGRTRSLFSSLFFRVAGSSLTCNVTERCGHAAFPSPSFRVAGSSLTCNVTGRFGQHRSTHAFFHVAGSFLACNVTERFGKRRSTLAFFHVAGSSLACNVTERLRTAMLPCYP